MDRLRPEKDPESIELRSFAIIDAEVGFPRPFEGRCWEVARRLVHTTADFGILHSLLITEAAIDAGLAALGAGCHIFTDTRMALAGIPPRRLTPLGLTASCLLEQTGVAARAKEDGITQSRAAIECAGDALKNAVIAVGNAPTTLIALVQHLQNGGKAPALIIGMPVGFVNAAESKELLLEETTVPTIILRGRRGGSPLAAATVNALLELTLRAKKLRSE